jgi:hypothetical protein
MYALKKNPAFQHTILFFYLFYPKRFVDNFFKKSRTPCIVECISNPQLYYYYYDLFLVLYSFICIQNN